MNNEIFHCMDNEEKGFLNGKNFTRILNQNGVFITDRELRSLMKRYDKDDDGKVYLEEFYEETKQNQK